MYSDFNIIIVLAFMYITLIVVLLLLLGLYLVPRGVPTAEKIAPYECGFDAFSENRSTFEVDFLLVSIIFLIFDIEVIFLYPLVVLFAFTSDLQARTELMQETVIFLGIITASFIYELTTEALDW